MNITMNKTIHKITLFGCVGFATALPVFGEPHSLLELPPQRSTEKAFKKYSRPLEEVDKDRLQELRKLGYDGKFRVISFDTICEGLKKSEKDFEEIVNNHGTILNNYIQSRPLPFCFCDFDGKVYDVALPFEVVKNQKAALLACLTGFEWTKKQKQLLALYAFLTKGRSSLKLMSGFNGGYTYITMKGDVARYVIYVSNALFQVPSMVTGILTHEMKHALYYELGLSADPALCSYSTKFIRDVYQLPQGFSSGAVAERTVKAIYNQCPGIAHDWHSIEEAWNALGFCEIDGTVYINEFADCALPYGDKDSEGVLIKAFEYHQPCFTMLSFVCRDFDRWNAYLNRQFELVSKDWRTGAWKNFDKEDENNEKGSCYLKAISVSLNMPPFGENWYQGDKRKGVKDLVCTQKVWLDTYLKLGGSDGMPFENVTSTTAPVSE